MAAFRIAAGGTRSSRSIAFPRLVVVKMMVSMMSMMMMMTMAAHSTTRQTITLKGYRVDNAVHSAIQVGDRRYEILQRQEKNVYYGDREARYYVTIRPVLGHHRRSGSSSGSQRPPASAPASPWSWWSWWTSSSSPSSSSSDGGALNNGMDGHASSRGGGTTTTRVLDLVLGDTSLTHEEMLDLVRRLPNHYDFYYHNCNHWTRELLLALRDHIGDDHTDDDHTDDHHTDDHHTDDDARRPRRGRRRTHFDERALQRGMRALDAWLSPMVEEARALDIPPLIEPERMRICVCTRPPLATFGFLPLPWHRELYFEPIETATTTATTATANREYPSVSMWSVEPAVMASPYAIPSPPKPSLIPPPPVPLLIPPQQQPFQLTSATALDLQRRIEEWKREKQQRDTEKQPRVPPYARETTLSARETTLTARETTQTNDALIITNNVPTEDTTTTTYRQLSDRIRRYHDQHIQYHRQRQQQQQRLQSQQPYPRNPSDDAMEPPRSPVEQRVHH